MNTGNYSLLYSLFYDMVNGDCWKFINISSKQTSDADKIEEFEKDINFFYLALLEENLEAFILPENEMSGTHCAQGSAQAFSLLTQQTIFFPKCDATLTQNKQKKKKPRLVKDKIGFTQM